MEKLGVAASTVYHLAKTKRIEIEILPQGVSRTKRYSKSSVDHYYLTKHSVPNGVSISEFAKLHKVTNQRLYQLIHKLDLSVEKVVVGNRQRLILSSEQQQVLLDELEHKTHKGTKSDFYLFAKDIALFQLFYDAKNEFYRIIRNDRNEWGIVIALSNEFLPFEKALIEQSLKPAYTIHQPAIASNAYVNFIFQTNNANTYAFLDLCYEQLGIENMHILHKGSQLEVSLKAVNLQVKVQPLLTDYLNECCLNAVVEVSDGAYHFDVQDKAVTITLKGGLYTALKQASTAQRVSLSDYINQMLQQQLENK